MDWFNTFAHGLVLAITQAVKYLLTGVEITEDGLRNLMHGAGFDSDAQVLLLLLILFTTLFGVLSLLHKRVRIFAALFVILIIVHILERLANATAVI